MRLSLNELRNDLPLFLKFIEVFSLEIADADRLRLAFFVRFFKKSVARKPVPCRLVYEKKIDIIQAETLKRFIDRVCVLKFAGPKFR